jgi:hypothetical protein
MHNSEAKCVRVNGLQASSLPSSEGNPRKDVSSLFPVTGSLAAGYERIPTSHYSAALAAVHACIKQITL